MWPPPAEVCARIPRAQAGLGYFEFTAYNYALMASGEVAPTSRASPLVLASPDKLAQGIPRRSTPLRRRSHAQPAMLSQPSQRRELRAIPQS